MPIHCCLIALIENSSKQPTSKLLGVATASPAGIRAHVARKCSAVRHEVVATAVITRQFHTSSGLNPSTDQGMNSFATIVAGMTPIVELTQTKRHICYSYSRTAYGMTPVAELTQT